MKKIYLAGFDVFRQDPKSWGEGLKRTCAEFGFEGLFPLDNEAPADLGGQALARWIYDANIALLEGADYVMANLDNFRGAEPDSGTCFEVGFAVARDIPVWAYVSDTRPLVEQVPCRTLPDGTAVDESGYIVEDFGLARNLMLSRSSTVIRRDARACLKAMAARRDRP